jgi:hypothetical protein
MPEFKGESHRVTPGQAYSKLERPGANLQLRTIQQVEDALDAELLQLTSDRHLTAKLTAKRMANYGRRRTSTESRSARSNVPGRQRTSTDTGSSTRKLLLYPLSYEATAQRVSLAAN